MFSIIPQPKTINLKEGFFSNWSNQKIYVDLCEYENAGIIKGIIEKQTGFDTKIYELKKHCYKLIIAEHEPDEGRIKDNFYAEKPESYRIDIHKMWILVQAVDLPGLFYGIQTLYQIIEDNAVIPCCTIDDSPDMPMRGVHFDLKGGTPKFEYLKESIDRLAQFKINTILVEYEDKIRYRKNLLQASQSAFSIEQVEEFVELANKRHIQIIPLLQSLGHAEYILRHEQYAHLRETDDFFQQMCPSNPSTFELFKESFDELDCIHPETKYFHIGGDETRQLGECALCKKNADEKGVFYLYFEYIKKVCEYVISKGKVPMIWDDIITRHIPEMIKELPEETVLAYWRYEIEQDTVNEYPDMGRTVFSRCWSVKQYEDFREFKKKSYPGAPGYHIENLPEEKYELLKKHSPECNFPKEINSTVYIKFIKDNGHDVIGASAAQYSAEGVVTNPQRAVRNIRTWAKAISEAGEKGVISTAWTRAGSFCKPNGIMEGLWPAFAASGEFYWSGMPGIDEKEFDRKYNKRFYGIDGYDATDLIWLMRNSSHVSGESDVSALCSSLSKKVKKNAANLEYYSMLAKLQDIIDRLEYLEVISERHGYSVNNSVLTQRERKSIERLSVSIKDLLINAEEEMRKVYSVYIQPSEVEDCIKGFFQWNRRLLQFYTTEGTKANT